MLSERGAGWRGFIAASALSFFAQATTFASLGVVAFAMGTRLYWPFSAIGDAYMALGLSCCVTSMLPVLTIPRIGARGTIAMGGAVLAAGCALAAITTSLTLFLLATSLFGLAFSLLANTSCTYLVAGWFAHRAPRMIGLYLMISALGGAAGPPVAQALIASAGGAARYWGIMAGLAVLLSALCAGLITEPPAVLPDDMIAGTRLPIDDWRLRETVLTPQFLLIAAAMVFTQLCILTVAGVASPHITLRGGSAAFAADMLGLQALIGTAATGLSGWLSEHLDARRMQAAGLLFQALGMGVLAAAPPGWSSILFALLFGIGWSVTTLTVTVLLIGYFGPKRGSAALSLTWTLSGVAAFGPALAGYLADRWGGFGVALAAMGAVLVPLAIGSLMLVQPGRKEAVLF